MLHGSDPLDGPLVFDGAMGTYLYEKGIFINRCFEQLNLTEGELIEGVHRDYLNAGADVIETNTFAANSIKLSQYGLEGSTQDINRAAVAIAQKAVMAVEGTAEHQKRKRAMIAGAVGPTGKRLLPLGTMSAAHMHDVFAQQVAVLVESGVDLVVLETFGNLDELRLAIEATRAVSPDIYLIAQATLKEDLCLTGGSTIEMFAREAKARGANALGFNCSVGPKYMLEALESLRAHTWLPVSIQPNAGYPVELGGRNIYLTSPEYLGEYARRFLEAGAHIVGGCCGTRPEHIARIAQAVRFVKLAGASTQSRADTTDNFAARNIDQHSSEHSNQNEIITHTKNTTSVEYSKQGSNQTGYSYSSTNALSKGSDTQQGATPKAQSTMHDVSIEVTESRTINGTVIPLSRCPSKLAASLAANKFIHLVELVSSKGSSPHVQLERARLLKARGIDAVNIPDGPRASPRMSALALAAIIEREAGMETVLHYACRDRNLIGMQADILGGWALGVRNILAVTGDPPKLGTYPDATAVFDTNSVGLTGLIHGLNSGQDLAGNFLKEATAYCIGVGVNPGALDLDAEIAKLENKIAAGAQFVITQPVFDISVFERFARKTEGFGIPIICGVWPLSSYRNAEFMNNEVPGMSVPESIMQRMRNASNGEAAFHEGMNIAREAIRAIRSGVAGVQLSSPTGRLDALLELIEE